MSSSRFLIGIWSVLAASGLSLLCLSAASIVYVSLIGVHVITALVLVIGLTHATRRLGWASLLAWPVAATGLVLLVLGGSSQRPWPMQLHVSVALGATALGVLVVTRHLARTQRWGLRAAAAGVLALALSTDPAVKSPIVNPETVPATMDQEGAGRGSPFFPSSIETPSGGHTDTTFIMKSEACGRCHTDIYDQWKASMHHLSSFNNPFYRRAIEYMQPIAGIEATKWCAGCHDHAVLLNGMMDRPVNEIADTPEGQAGMGCLSCHAMTRVKSTMGNADFEIGPPPLGGLLFSENRWARRISDFVIHLNPKPHRAAFMKSFHRDQPSEFCSSCHKVHLDVPVNQYRWFRGFNEYDNWQGSGVSGQGARSFYYPETAQTCVSCHMPQTPSNDPAAKNGMIRSHFFPGANTAVPTAIGDVEHLRINEAFLRNNKMRVDIFAVARDVMPVESEAVAAAASTSFAVGEEAEERIPRAITEDSQDIQAPIDRTDAVVQAGTDVRVDVVVRTLALGHFFPAGTVDAFDTWLELKATDSDGRIVFWSGQVADEGKGPVDPTAHFYRSLQIDGQGNPINRRNAWATRAVVYVNLIPPGSAEVARFRLRIGKDVSGPIQLEARLNYRKFTHSYTEFTFEGKTVPVLPIVTLASAKTSLKVSATGQPAEPLALRPAKQDRERWNDYGIGLFRQGDLRAALRAFTRVTELDPQYVDGWINAARVLIESGQTREAMQWLDRALRLSPDLARAHYFRALALKAEGDYAGARAALQIVEKQFPKDRVVLNQIGRIHFQERDYPSAIAMFKRTLAIDPEDVTAHYNLMLSYRGLGNAEASAESEKRYLRFKADESAQTLAGEYRRRHPIDNKERQPIHIHDSAPVVPSDAPPAVSTSPRTSARFQ